jgi:hypothetical protein
MGLRFRRSWSVLPGIRLNLGLRGGSVSFGTRGIHYTVGSSGSRVTVGLPGTGLFWTQKLSSPFGITPLGRTNQPQTHAAPLVGGGQKFGAAHPASTTVHAPQISQLHQPSALQPPPLSATYQTPQPTHHHVFVPTWLVWSVISAVVIGALCLGAAVVGSLLR